MALQLDKELATGFIASYWRIDRIEIDKKNKLGRVTMNLYKDKTASTDKDRIVTQEFYWEKAEYPFSVQALDDADPFKIAYAKIKTLPDWSSAQDI